MNIEFSRKYKPQKFDIQVAKSQKLRERRAWLAAIAADRRVKSGAFEVAWVIESFVSTESDEAWPSQELIAKRVGMTKRAVAKHIAALRSAGWLKVLSGKDRTNPKSLRGAHYRLQWPEKAQKDVTAAAERPSDSEPTAATLTRQRGTTVHLSMGTQQAAEDERTCARIGTDVHLPNESDKSLSEPPTKAAPNKESDKSLLEPPTKAAPNMDSTAPLEAPSLDGGSSYDSEEVRAVLYAHFADVFDDPDWNIETEASLALEEHRPLPPGVDAFDPSQVLAFSDGYSAAEWGSPREVTEPFDRFPLLSRAWFAGYDRYAQKGER